jgi:protein-glutamine gamma-glutamyltransferase
MNSKLFYAIITFIFCFFPHTFEAPIWVSGLTAVLAGMALYVSRTGRVLISKRGIRALTFILPALIWLQFRTILGPEPASALLCLLVALKLHEVDSSRDEQVILILNTLVVMCWLLFSQSLLTTIYMIVALLMIGIGLIAIQTPKRTIRHIIFNTPTRIGLDIALALPLFLLFFFLFPRFTTPITNLFNTQKTQTGFSDDLNPGMWANLVQSDEVAFRVLFKDAARVRPNQLYWRGLVLTDPYGFSWRRPVRTALAARPVNEEIQGDIEYELILEPRYGRTLFHLEAGTDLKIKDPLIRNRALPRGSYYNLTSENFGRLSLLGKANLSSSSYQDGVTATDTELSGEISQPMLNLVNEFKKAGSPELIARAILDYFSNNNFSYSTSTPTMTTIDDFLFRFKIGFCEHYASAFTLLMRAAGVPARAVIGFQGGEYNNFGDYLVVRDRNAHAWSEVYIENRGWIRFDPTTAVNSTRIETGDFVTPLFAGLDRNSTLVQNLQSVIFYFESINTTYILFLLNFNSDMQIEWLSSIGLKNITKPKLLFTILAALVAFFVIAFIIIYYRPNNSSPLSRGYKTLLAQLAKRGHSKLPHEGPLSFLQKIETNELNSKGDLTIHKKLLLEYISLAYGPSHEKQHLDFLKQTERL